MSTSSPNNSFKRKSLSTKPQPSSCTKKSTRPDLIPLIFDDPFLEEEQEGEKVFCSKTVEKELKKDIQPDSMDWLETQYSLLHAMDTHDVDNLRTFGLQSGFQTLSLRRKVWPLLLKLDFNVHKWPSTPQTHTEVSNVTPLKSSKIGTVSPIKQPQLSPSLLHNSPRSAPSTSSTKNYAEQISLDIKRSFTQFPCLLNARTKSRKQKQLELILYEFYSTYTSLHYYQGWHDIGAVFLLLFNDMEVTKQALERVAIFYLRDAMHASLEPILFQMLFLLPILKREDRSLYHLFERTQLHPYFCLSWIITWYAHDLKDFECICRIFDFCLCTNPILPIYMSTALVLMNRDAILDQEPDYALLHHFLSTLPSQSDTLSNHLEEWLAFSFQLYQRYPLTTLKALTGWTFPSQSASLRFEHDFLLPSQPVLLANAQLEPLMQCKFSFPKDTPYVFKPLALIRRVGKTYVFVEGDVTKMFMMAMAVGLIGITLSSTQSSSFSTYFTEYSMNMTPSSLLLQREGEELWTHFTTFVKNMVLSLIFR